MRNAGPNAGDIIAGRYRVRSVLGRGRGVLVLAEQLTFDQKVAIRIVSPQASDPTEVAKFRREAKALAVLGSEHVARILDVGSLPDGSLFLVRQYLEGVDLATHVQKRGALPVQEAVGSILQATEAIAEAHAYGILHRELRPEHLLAERTPGVRGGRPVLKVIDFGTSKLFRESGSVSSDPHPTPQETTTTTVLGLSPYSPPEMLRRQRDLDVRADVWSLGAILYEMLCGRPPFGRDMVSLAVAISRDDPTPLSGLNPDVASELEAAVDQALSKDREGRPANTHAFAAALAPFAPPEGRLLMDRIRELASSRLGLPQAPDLDDIEEVEAELEISQVEEVIEADETPSVTATVTPAAAAAAVVEEEESTGDNEETRVARPNRQLGLLMPLASAPRQPVVRAAALPPVPAPDPSDSQATIARTSPVARRPMQEKTETLGRSFVPIDPLPKRKAGGPVFAGAAAPDRVPGQPGAPTEKTALPPFLPPADLAQSQRMVVTGPPRAPDPTPTSSPWSSSGAHPRGERSFYGDDEPSFGRKMAMYAIGVGFAAILILAAVLVVMVMRGR